MGIEVFAKHIREKRAVKIETGFNNTDLNSVSKICSAAQNAKASAVDIVASKEVYDVARKNTKLPIFVSSIHPFDILEAVKWGVDAVEIGKYDDFYTKGIKFSETEFYDIVLETIGLINQYDVYTSVVIPGYFDISQQVALAKKFELLGINLIQIEGVQPLKLRKFTSYIKDSNISIENTFEINKMTKLPIITSMNVDSKNLNEAFLSGASGLNIDNLAKFDTEIAMTTEIRKIVGSISHRNSLNRELVRSQIELAFN